MKSVVIIGASFSGQKVGQLLLKKLKDVEVTVIEKQQELSYNVAMPRAIVDPEFALKTFIPFTNMLQGSGKIVHGTVIKVNRDSVELKDGQSIKFDYLVIASGSSYEGIFKLQNESKDEALRLLKSYQEKVSGANNIVLVGGGAVSIEVAGEIKEYFPQKNVTIVHSDALLLGKHFPDSSRSRISPKLEKLGVKLIFNEKVLNIESPVIHGSHILKTESGKEISSDLTLKCIGRSTPNSKFLASLAILNDKEEVKVKSTLQVDKENLSHIFALGDVAATGYSKTVVPLDKMADLVAENIAALINGKALKELPPQGKEIIIFSVGKNDAGGYIPFLPYFAVDFIGRKLKSADLFVGRACGFYNHKTN